MLDKPHIEPKSEAQAFEQNFSKMMEGQKTQQIKEFLLKDQQQLDGMILENDKEISRVNNDSKDDIDDGAMGGEKRSQ